MYNSYKLLINELKLVLNYRNLENTQFLKI